MQHHIDRIRQCLKTIHPTTAAELAGAAAIEKDLLAMEADAKALAECRAYLRGLLDKMEAGG